ncbi:MAG: DUF192 domain-containing protein [Aestuariivirga sp.]|uniref:DUF192 domain-containing protein n=1 Tax=Aestuariivirga sp. TaxID=2650926 RepID=UPI0038D11DE9
MRLWRGAGWTSGILTFSLMLFLALVPPQPAVADAALSKIEPVTIATEDDAWMFTTEIADTEELRQRGLMFRQHLAEDRGMLFDFGEPRPVAMWMKNTLIPLDMLFIRKDGTIAYIAENTTPGSLDAIGVTEPVLAVLELAGGVTRKHGIRAGDTVYHRLFNNAR